MKCLYTRLVMYMARVRVGSGVRVRVRSLKVIETSAIPKLGCGFLFAFYSTVSIAVSVAVCEIFSTKEKYDLENKIRVRSRSLEMTPFDRSHTNSYPPSIVTMALCCIVCEI